MSEHPMDVRQLYKERFSSVELQKKNKIWKVLCDSFFQQFIREDQVVLDVGAGYCEFINHIRCAQKFAVDPNGDTARYAASDVRVFKDLSFLSENSLDVVFMSNFLEHMKSKESILKLFEEVRRALKADGRLLILQPNIRFAYREYWDFFDHCIALSDRSLVEGLCLAGFQIEKVLPRFLPYTTKSRMPQDPWWVRMYLKMPWAWWVFGKQAFVVARKKCTI